MSCTSPLLPVYPSIICYTVISETQTFKESKRLPPPCAATVAEVGVVDEVIIRVSDAPDQMAYDPTDERLRKAATMLQDALDAPTVEKEEAGWTAIINQFESVQADWVPDIVGRAYGNRCV